MRTLVVSDFHLGARSRIDLASRADLRAPLLAAVGEVDRVVLLGDTLELRHGPVREVLAAAERFFRDLGAALGPDREVVLLAGNHDHHLLAPWLERRARDREPPPLDIEEEAEIRDDDGPLARLAAWLAPARLRAAYPGVWLRPDVYAMHGHYLDRHVTVPTFERLAVGAMHRLNGTLPDGHQRPDDYEAALAPVYAWIHAMAQAAPERGVGAHGASTQLWESLARGSGHRPLRSSALRTGVAVAIATLNRAGLGPLRADVSGAELRRAGLSAMGEVVGRLGIDARHVIFGHTHRSGPWPGDASEQWMTPSGARLVNTGSWVYERHFLTRNPNESPYWPGTAVVVEDEGPPRLERLLGYRGHADLRPASRAGVA